MRSQLMRGFVVCVLATIVAQEAAARKPPPPVPFDVILSKAERVVVGRVLPGSLKSTDGLDRKGQFQEMTLIVTRSLDGKELKKEVIVTMGSFPAKAEPPSKEHPNGQYLLLGWSAFGERLEAEIGLDLYAEQVWFLEQFPPTRVSDPASPYGVNHFESVRALEYAPLVELFVRQTKVASVREHIQKAYKGKTPQLAIQGLYRSNEPAAAAALIWEHLDRYDEVMRKVEKLSLEEKRGLALKELEAAGEFYPYYAFRTLNSLGRHDALPYVRKCLASQALRVFALESVKRFADTDSVPVLVKLLPKVGYSDAERIIGTLGEIGDVRAIPALIDQLAADSPRRHVELALFQLTDIRFSSNGDYARRWWDRNKDRPRWHWLKQGIEQDLYLLRYQRAIPWQRDVEPAAHFDRVTCWHHERGSTADAIAARAKWWQANKDLPQERWVMDSFNAVGHPLPDLASKEAGDVLAQVFATEPGHWWSENPVIDGYLHHYWCHQLLTRLTGWDLEDTHYLHYSKSHWFNHETTGKAWLAEWKKSRYGVKIYPISVPERQPFTMDAEDLRLLTEDFETLKAEILFKGPLVRKEIPGLLGKYIVGTFEITLTNQTKREIILHAKPDLVIQVGVHQGSGSTWGRKASQSTTHDKDFATLKPGDSIRWTERDNLSSWDNDQCWVHYELRFDASKSWRGSVATPWLPVRKENIREE